VLFNFGIPAYSPVRQLLCLRRILKAGIRPDRVVVEWWPPLMHPWYADGEADKLNVCSLDRDDLRLLLRFTHVRRGAALAARWYVAHGVPAYSSRFRLLARFAPSWLTADTRWADTWRNLSRCGWVAPPEQVDPEVCRREQEAVRTATGALVNPLCIAESTDRALCEILGLCREQHIPAALLFMPESGTFRGCYAPESGAEVERYLGRLRAEYGVPVIDCRTWLADECFWDSVHLLARGTAAFMERFGREVLPGLLEMPAPRPQPESLPGEE
jgi:hypothetical protein